MKKNNIILYLCIVLFGALGVYLTFFASNTNKYDSQTKAYKTEVHESEDIDSGTMYSPTYYFKVNGRDYECRAKSSSSSYPSEKKNTVYYDSKNPEKCLTEYDKSSGRIIGIICLVITVFIIYASLIKKPVDTVEEYNETPEIDEEKVEKIMGIIGKFQLIFKRIVIGIVIIVLLVFIAFDTILVKQTIKAKDYIDVTAVYVSPKAENESEIFDDYIYSFIDKEGNTQEITVGISKDDNPKEEINIKYNEKDPQDYYEEGSTMDKSGIIWYVVKIVIVILLVILFFNKKILNKMNISVRNN